MEFETNSNHSIRRKVRIGPSWLRSLSDGFNRSDSMPSVSSPRTPI